MHLRKWPWILLWVSVFSGAQERQSPVYGAHAQAGHYVHVNDIRLYYEQYGAGHPIVLLHGNGGWINDFRNQIPDFANYFRVIAVDSRAQGLSSDSDQELTFSLMASDVAQLLDSLCIDSAYVVGWSDGGIIGLELALRYPQKVARLVTSGANFVPDSTALPEQMLEEMRGDSFAKLPPERQREITAHSHFPERAGLIYDKLNRLDLYHPNLTEEQLHSIQAPTLVMAGDHDIIIDTHTLRLYHALPHSELCIIPGGTHGFLLRKPDLANTIIKDFLLNPFKELK